MALDATRVISGNFGTVYDANGNWLTNITNGESSVDIGKEEINRAGTRWIGHKATSLTGTGTISGYKITSELVEKIGQIASDKGTSFVTEIQMRLDDPEAYGYEVIRLKNVQFDTIPLMGFEVGSIVEQEFPFTFTEYDFLNKIEA